MAIALQLNQKPLMDLAGWLANHLCSKEQSFFFLHLVYFCQTSKSQHEAAQYLNFISSRHENGHSSCNRHIREIHRILVSGPWLWPHAAVRTLRTLHLSPCFQGILWQCEWQKRSQNSNSLYFFSKGDHSPSQFLRMRTNGFLLINPIWGYCFQTLPLIMI